ncbi:MAG: MBOAT family O-acyltransferase [Myxococcales bacterium]|jgi:alginate O-acetyltransferase complex protein AlgI
MYFHSLQFLAFLVVSHALYWAVHRCKAARLGVLLLASLAFYAAWSPFPILIFVWCAVVDFLAVKGMARWQRPAVRKLLLAVSVVSDIGVLCTFKYADLFYSTAAWLLGRVGIEVRYEPLGLLLPIGLSFVCFQAVSLVVDVYRGQLEPKQGFFEHLLFLLFFPQVVAGPIVRAKDLLARFGETPVLDSDAGVRGIYRIAIGIAKKLLVADLIAAGLVDRVFAEPTLYSSAECLMATIGYTLQLYFDFSAYSDIAIGAAALFGFKLPENFNKPYLARNLFEFWNRWHISLSTWLRDYVYIPLGGNRRSRPRVLLNLMIVMTVGGLWHGADWRFALWGAIHGVGLVIIRCYWWLIGGRPKQHTLLGSAAGIVATFAVVVFTRIVFRASDLTMARVMFERLLEFSPGLANVSVPVWIAMGAALVGHYLPHRAFSLSADLFARLPAPVRATALVALGLAIRKVGMVEVRPYIYFQF